MAFTKFARFEDTEILDIRGSNNKIKNASLSRLSDYDDYRTEQGFMYVRARAISSRINKNWDSWPSVELAGGQDLFDSHLSASRTSFTVQADRDRKYGFSTFLGKPIFVDHHNSDPSRARGVVVDAKLHVEDAKTSSIDSYYSSSDVDPLHLPPTWVELLMEVDAQQYPRLAKALLDGSKDSSSGIDGFSMGANVAWTECNICGNKAEEENEFCEHIRLGKGAYYDYIDPRSGTKTSRRAAEHCFRPEFFEFSCVFDPADETALMRELIHKEGKTAEALFPPCPGCNQVAGFKNYPFTQGYLECNNCGKLVSSNELASIFNNQSLDLLTLPETEHPLGPNYGSVKESVAGINEGDNICNNCNGKGFIGNVRCPQCAGGGFQPGDDQFMPAPNLNLENLPGAYNIEHEMMQLSNRKKKALDENRPQSLKPHAPEAVETLREETICELCGSDMDTETCDVCGWTRPPEGFQDPDLDKAKDLRAQNEDSLSPEPPAPEIPEAPPEPEPLSAPPPDLGAEQPIMASANKLAAPTRVRGDMAKWDINVHPRLAGRVNVVERPISTSGAPATDEPKEEVVSDPKAPVTKRTASELKDFIERAQKKADAASGAPADAKADANVDGDGAGGVIDPSNEAASEADAQVDTEGVGGTGVEDVSADKENQSVTGGGEAGGFDSTKTTDDSGPTTTWDNSYDNSAGDVETQADPVTGDTFPASAEGVKSTAAAKQAYDSAPFPEDDGDLSGGSAVKGTQPADPVGVAQKRINVLQPVTSPANNSGPTDTWSGTDGSKVERQVDPTTNESLEGEDIVNLKSGHIFTAFKLADLEVDLGLISKDDKYSRVAELESKTPAHLAGLLEQTEKVKTAGIHRQAKTAKRMPSLSRKASSSSTSPSTIVDESLFL